MRSWQRWAVVTLGVAALALTPAAIAHRPVAGSAASAAELLRRIQGSAGVAYSGYAESVGTLSLPAADEVNDIAALFGGRSQLRIWWRSSTDWRLDTISAFGESDIHRDRAGTWTWDYERNRATRVTVFAEPALRLPAGRDLLPPEVGRRLLSEARPGEVRRIGARDIAGVTAAGLQLVPAEAQSSVRRVDVWADPVSGLTLRVDVYGDAKAASVSTSFLDLTIGRPAASTTVFVPPLATRLSSRGPRDLLSGIDRFTDATPPATLAGLNVIRRDGADSVGVYGRGVTSLVLTPMPEDIAGELRTRLIALSGQAALDRRIVAAFGPVNVMLFTDRGDRNWLLSGTVTLATLTKAADELDADPPRRR
ncbi:MAG: transcriptional regulator [Actinomycetota bacterium]|nr:transcriptional regulator [Actinomycetota bacterium]